MPRRSYQLILSLALLSIIAGWLLSHASWLGRTGIRLFYKEYGFLNSWWQASLAVFGVWGFLYGMQSLVQRFTRPALARAVHIILILDAVIGLYFTYADFRASLSHRWLGERFHLGAYLFWIGWIIISVYFLVGKKQAPKEVSPV